MDNIKDDQYYLAKVLGDVNRIISYVEVVDEEDFIHNEELIDAICFRIIQIEENFKLISDKFKYKNPQIQYHKIKGFRNRIVHEYGKIDYHIVYLTAKNDMIELKKILENATL